jgi:hypothetical protein
MLKDKVAASQGRTDLALAALFLGTLVMGSAELLLVRGRICETRRICAR